MTQFDPEFTKKLQEFEAKKPVNRQLRILEDIANIAQETLSVLDASKKASQSDFKALGALLDDARQQLSSISQKETPETPDFSKPIVEALNKLEASLASAVEKEPPAPIFKPNIKVDAPQVKVNSPDVSVDTSKLEKIVKQDIPKAFEKAIKAIPKTPEIKLPESADYTNKFDTMLEWLQSIDTATRLKPIPGSMQVTKKNGVDLDTGASTIITNQVSVASTATSIVAANATRTGVLITNLGTTDVYLGTSSVTTSTGSLLLGTKGTALFIPTTAQIYGIVGTGTQSVSYLETYN